MKSSISPAIRSEGALDEPKDIEICVEEWPMQSEAVRTDFDFHQLPVDNVPLPR